MPRILILLSVSAALLSACINMPDLDDAVSEQARSGRYPKLAQLEGVEDAAFEGAEVTEKASASLKSRAERLRKRATKLRRPIIDRRTKNRMAAALKRHLR